MTEKKFQLTRDEFDRLKKRLEHLQGDARKEIIDAIARAREHGDLSENAEYHAAKDQQGLQESEVRRIRHMLENAEIVEAADDAVAGPGKLVTIREPGSDPETYLLGVRIESVSEYDVLTPDSPLGRAIVGRSPGETVVAEVPAGEMRVEIVEVRSP